MLYSATQSKKMYDYFQKNFWLTYNFLLSPQTSRTQYALVAATDIPKHSDIFIIDQVWTTTFTKAFESLLTNQKLRLTCCQLMGIDSDEFAAPPDDDTPTPAESAAAERPLAELSVSVDPCFPSGHCTLLLTHCVLLVANAPLLV